MNWPALLTGGLGAAVVSALVALYRAYLHRPLIQASAVKTETKTVTDSALALLRQAEASAAASAQRAERAEKRAEQAQQDANQARAEASDARREAVEARRETMDVIRDFRRVKLAILSPYATLDKLREMVGDPPPANGTQPTVNA